jgi:alpha-glucosidase
LLSQVKSKIDSWKFDFYIGAWQACNNLFNFNDRYYSSTMKTGTLFLITILSLATSCSDSVKVSVLSPDGNINLVINSKDKKGNRGWPSFYVECSGKSVLLPSFFQLTAGNNLIENEFDVLKIEYESISNNWINNFGERREIPDNYNQAKFFLSNREISINLICRVYNEGIAFAYEFPEQSRTDSVTVQDEKIIYRFPGDYPAWSAPRAQAAYSKVPLSQIVQGCERPLVIEIDSSLVIALAEAKLVDYSRMKFYPDTTTGNGIRSRLDSPVRKAVPFQSPWRVIMIGKNPGDLLEKNYLLLNLNDPSEIEDVSWIRPGKVLRETTLTTEGAKAAIDFTSAHKMQYVEFDAGWYGPENDDNSDARSVNLDPARSKGPLDLEEVIKYANSKNIGILLYVNRKALERQLDELLPLYRKWGIAGIKFGFVQVGNQKVTRWLHESVKKAAQYRMVVDVHDEYRPTGFSRTYPNFLTMEGIRGDEESPPNSHTLITMFTRMLAGQGDNTICYFNERVENKMGSHASQLAKAVCIFSPLQFLYWYDKAPSANIKYDGSFPPGIIGNEPELEFFDDIPTIWDDTKVLYAKIAEYAVIARRKGNEWFIGGINGETPRNLELSFSFLDPYTKYSAKIYSDDPDVKTRTHVKIDTILVDSKSVYQARIGIDNGIAIHLVPLK